MAIDFHVHGLWILGALFFFVGGIMAGNLQWLEGTTSASFAISAVLIFLLFLIAAAFWISAAVNARHEEFARMRGEEKCKVCLHIHRDGKVCENRHDGKGKRCLEEMPTESDC